MTTLPATVIEAEALIEARDGIRRIKDGGLSFLGVDDLHFMEKEDSRRFARELMKRLAANNSAYMMHVAECARAGYRLADEALRELILDYVNREEKLPTALASYSMVITGGAVPNKRPAPERSDKVLRDIAITTMVLLISEKFAIKPTRNLATSKPSACSIVAAALEGELMAMSEANVVAIWRRYSPAL